MISKEGVNEKLKRDIIDVNHLIVKSLVVTGYKEDADSYEEGVDTLFLTAHNYAYSKVLKKKLILFSQ